IDRIAPATTEELMHYITAITTAGSITVSQANGTITTSQSTVSLRGLGSTRTLVLVNGRRVAVFGGTNSTAVDVNSIPVEAIERIEVLKEGASSLYGSDAVAGVVNFILRRDFKGADVRATYGSPTRSGGGKEVQASAFLGFGDLDRDRYNVNIGAGYHKIDPIMGSDRSFAHNINVGERNDLSSTIAFPANILFGPNFSRIASPAFPDCGPDSIVSPFFANNANSGRACRFENSPFLTVQSGEKQENVLVNARYRFTPQVEGYVETGYVHNEISYVTQPVPVAPNTNLPATNPYNAFLRNLIATQYPNLAPGLARFSTLNDTLMLLPPSSPFYPTAFVASLGLPTNQPIAFDYRDFANGPRHTRDESDNSRIVAGARGTFGAWDYDSAFLYSESKAKSNLVAGYPQWSHFLPLLDTGVINPFGPTTDPATLAAVQAAEFRGVVYKSKTSTTSVDAKLSRELMELHGGAAALALGGELREEAFRFDPSAEFEVGDIGGFGGNVLPVDRRRHVGSVYTEIDAPFLRTFEADLGVRYDNYQTIGSTTNPKLSVRWQPNPQVLVRASTGTGFRAPSLTDLYTAQANSVTANGTRDPIRCPNPATGQPTDCNNQFPTITGGNPNLKPEKSHSNTLGFVFEPTRDISMSIDFFWIQLKDSIVIGGLPFNFILANAANATQFSSFIIRGAPDGNASGVGPITDVIQTNANLFKRNVDGWDVDLEPRPGAHRDRRHRAALAPCGERDLRHRPVDGLPGGELPEGLPRHPGQLLRRQGARRGLLRDVGPAGHVQRDRALAPHARREEHPRSRSAVHQRRRPVRGGIRRHVRGRTRSLRLRHGAVRVSLTRGRAPITPRRIAEETERCGAPPSSGRAPRGRARRDSGRARAASLPPRGCAPYTIRRARRRPPRQGYASIPRRCLRAASSRVPMIPRACDAPSRALRAARGSAPSPPRRRCASRAAGRRPAPRPGGGRRRPCGNSAAPTRPRRSPRHRCLSRRGARAGASASRAASRSCGGTRTASRADRRSPRAAAGTASAYAPDPACPSARSRETNEAFMAMRPPSPRKVAARCLHATRAATTT